jgi:hypothetical protein
MRDQSGVERTHRLGMAESPQRDPPIVPTMAPTLRTTTTIDESTHLRVVVW